MTVQRYRATARKDLIEQAIALDPLAAFSEIAAQVGCDLEVVLRVVDRMDRAVREPPPVAAKHRPSKDGPARFDIRVRGDHTGSHRAFNRHKKRGEAPCALCVTAERAYQRARHVPRGAARAAVRAARRGAA